MLGGRDEAAKERRMEACKIKIYVYIRAKEVNKQYRMEINQDTNGNRKLFWKIKRQSVAIGRDLSAKVLDGVVCVVLMGSGEEPTSEDSQL